jgi:hypothetical protein
MTVMTDPVIPSASPVPPENAAATARRMWTMFEAVHVLSYFGPETRQVWEAAGLRGFWRGYFAGRAAPVGAVGAPVVIATFFSFAPAFVRRAVPAVWQLITPAQALAVREADAVAALRGRLGLAAGQDAPDAVGRAANLLLAAAGDLEMAGRPLGGPNAALPVPDEPLARLWQAATVLREHRGDGHIGALVAADIGGCEALALRSAVEETGVGRARMQAARGWTDEEWDAAAGRLAGRGWLAQSQDAGAGAATAAGRAAYAAVEAATDLAAARPWARLGPGRTAELADLLAPVARACAGALPYPNPVGVPEPG